MVSNMAEIFTLYGKNNIRAYWSFSLTQITQLWIDMYSTELSVSSLRKDIKSFKVKVMVKVNSDSLKSVFMFFCFS